MIHQDKKLNMLKSGQGRSCFVTMKLFSKSSLALPMNNQQRHSHGDKQPISFRSLQMVACKANKEQ
jgi:hypothetical protein